MKTIVIGGSALSASRLAYGCWRVAGTSNPAELTPDHVAKAVAAIHTAYETGYTLFDTADIYCRGEAEKILGRAIKQIPGMREKIVVATKCGIRQAGDPQPSATYRFDFSRDHIIRSCEQSLQRLGLETIDLYQLHRPDYLCEPAEVAGAFADLRRAGKVREFGVSNFRPSQVAMLQRACPMRLVVNQIELSLLCRGPFDDGTLDQCLEQNLTPLAWSPLAGGLLAEGARRVLSWQKQYRPEPVVAAVDQVAQERGVSRAVVGLAWLLRHPAGIVPIVGSAQPERIRECARAEALELSREEWYRLLEAARGERLP